MMMKKVEELFVQIYVQDEVFVSIMYKIFQYVYVMIRRIKQLIVVQIQTEIHLLLKVLPLQSSHLNFQVNYLPLSPHIRRLLTQLICHLYFQVQHRQLRRVQNPPTLHHRDQVNFLPTHHH